MRFAYHHCMCPPEQYIPLTRAAEEIGFDTVILPDSICYPREATSKYPYNADGSREFLEGVPYIEPFILISHLAAVTETIRFCISVQKTAVHEPVLLAKAISSLAILSGGRFMYGAGISPWAEDFEITNTPWELRGKRLDEIMEIVNGLMSGEYFGYQGEIFQLPEIKLCPVPDERPPILVGGHAKPALRRAARLGDGWISAGGDATFIGEMIGEIEEYRKEYERNHLPFEYQAMSTDAYSPDGIKRLRDLGVTEVVVAFRDVYRKEPDDKTVQQKIDQLKWFRDEVIEKSRG